MDTTQKLSETILDESTSPSILQDITLDKTSLFLPCSNRTIPNNAFCCPNFEIVEMCDDVPVDIDDDPNLHNDEDTMSASEIDAQAGTASGLTMKEYDERLKKLSADNFNLKLKIYFMECRLSKMEGIQDKDLIKENVELKVENEVQTKELESKQKLLCEACEAFEQLQSDHADELKRIKEEHEKEIQDLQIKLGALETSLNLLDDKRQSYEDGPSFSDHQQSNVLQENLAFENRDLELLDKLAELEKDLSEKNVELSKLQENNASACSAVHSFLRRVKTLKEEKDAMEEQLNVKEKMVEEMTQYLKSQGNDDTKILVATLAEKTKQLDECTEKLSRCHCGVEENMARIQELQAELLLLKSKEDHGQEKKELEAKQNEIDKLNSDLKKRTRYLQELVNKELWDKNKEIERLEKRIAEMSKSRTQNVEDLHEKLREATIETERLRLSEDSLRKACAVLTIRLEELADFLDSLLTDRLGMGLDRERRDVIKKAVDQSRDLSRNLTLSLDDASLISDVSMIHDQPLVITKLREQVAILSQQVRERDIELSLCHGDTTLKGAPVEDTFLGLSIPLYFDDQWLEGKSVQDDDENQIEKAGVSNISQKISTVGRFNRQGVETDASESEAWSEPDRSVSLARMGHIDAASLTPLRLSKCSISPGTSEETLNETKTSGKRTRSMEPDTKRLQSKVKSLEESNKSLQTQLSLLEKKHKILNRLKNDESVPELLHEVQRSFSDLQDSQDECNRIKEELNSLRVECLSVKDTLAAKEQLCEEKDSAISALNKKVDVITLEHELVIVEKEEALKKIQEYEVLRLKLEQRVAEIDKEIEELKKVKAQSESEIRDSMKKILSDAEQDKLQSERKIKELQQVVDCLREQVAQKTNEVENWAMTAEREKEETAELKRRLIEAEKSKVAVELKVKEFKEQITWMDSKLRELEQSIELADQGKNARMAEEVQKSVEARVSELKQSWVSRTEMDKTRKSLEEIEGRLQESEVSRKLLNEKIKETERSLMARINVLENEKQILCQQLDEIRVRDSENLLMLSQLQQEKLRLEDSLEHAITKQKTLLREQQTAEEFLHAIRNLEKQTDDDGSHASADSGPNELLWARTLNTSPDLGIESDQGRFSSLEQQDHKAQLPKMVDSVANQLQSENNELKRRLDETLAELAAANYHKKQMERAICKQLHKTHHILKKARVNFEMQDSDFAEDRH